MQVIFGANSGLFLSYIGKKGSQVQKQADSDGSNLQATASAADLSEALPTSPDPSHLYLDRKLDRGLDVPYWCGPASIGEASGSTRCD